MKKADIFILFSCDVWKSFCSYRFLMATTDPDLCVKAISEELEHSNMEYAGCETQEASNRLVKDFKLHDVPYIDGKLTYGAVIVAEDGVLV